MTRAACLLGLLLAGCSTVVPMQTASAVDRGRLRVGGQLSASGFCGDLAGGVLGLTRCTEYPDGVPLPEVRANGRYGVAPGFDVGASVQVQPQVAAPERVFQLGGTVDLKGELFRASARGVAHVLSVGLLAGGAVAGRFGLGTWAQAEWAVPFFYGVQLRRWELVLGLHASQRFTRSPGVTPPTDTVAAGVTLGLFRRAPAGFALQLGYRTDPARPTSGTLQVQAGWFVDLL